MTFDPKTIEPILDAMSAQLAKDEKATVKALDLPLKASLKSHVGAVAECISIGLIFLNGFEEISSGGALRGKVAEPVQKWVDTVQTTQSGTRIAGMMGSSICSVLEGFIADIGPTKLTPARLASIRLTEPQLDSDDEKARAILLRRVRPSVKADGAKWLGSLNKVFSVSPTSEEGDTLVDMITFRNQYVHDPPAAFAKTITGEHLKCWAVAVMILCHRIAVS